MVDAVEQHEEDVCTQEHRAIFDDFAVLGEEFYGKWCKGEDGNGNYTGNSKGKQDGRLCAFVRPFG